MKPISFDRSSFTLSLNSKSIVQPSGSECEAAVHDERLSAHVGGEGRSEEQRDSRHLLDGAETAHRNLLDRPLAPLGIVHGDFCHLGIDQAGSDPVDSYAIACPRLSQRTNEADGSRF